MSQALTGLTLGIGVALFVAIYLAVRFWAQQRYPLMKHDILHAASGVKTQRRSLSSEVQHPSMDVD